MPCKRLETEIFRSFLFIVVLIECFNPAEPKLSAVNENGFEDLHAMNVGGNETFQSKIEDIKVRRIPLGRVMPVTWAFPFHYDISFPSNAEMHLLKAWEQARELGTSGEFQKAFLLCNEALKTSNESVCFAPLLACEALAFLRMGRIDLGYSMLFHSIRCKGLEKTELPLMYNLAEVIVSQNHALEEITVLENAEGVSVLGRLRMTSMLYYAMGWYSKAERHLSDLSTIQPSDPIIWLFLGKSQYWIGNMDRALSCFERALDVDKRNQDALYEMGITHFLLGNQHSAESIWNELLLLNPLHILGLQNYGQLLMKSGDYSRAIPYLRRCLVVNSSEHFCQHLLGECYHGLGKFSVARIHLETAHQLDPGDTSVHEMYYTFYNRIHLDSKWRSIEEIDRKLLIKWMKGEEIVEDMPYYEENAEDVLSDSDIECLVQGKLCSDVSLPSVAMGSSILVNFEKLYPVLSSFGRFYHLKNTRGFLLNRRQQMAMALATVEMVQLLHSNESASFRSFVDVAVRWRRVAEFSDLTFWNQDEFVARTPLIDGEYRIVKYYPQFERAFDLFKELVKNEFPSAAEARSLEELESSLGSPGEFSARIEISSNINPQRRFFGTDLTYSRQVYGFWFNIVTRGSPSRSRDYEEEINVHFQHLKSLFERPIQERDEYVESALLVAYYWFNYMPLVRGTAGIGYCMIQSFLAAVDIEISESLPANTLLDFEALFADTPDVFLAKAKELLNPSLGNREFSLHNLPQISRVFPTMRHVILALNYGVVRSRSV